MLRSNLIIPFGFPAIGYPRIYFYKLIDPITNEICYIGKTENPEKRCKQHCRAGYFDGNAYKDIWISNLVFKQNTYPVMDVFAWIDNSLLDLRAYKHEIQLINKFWSEGHPLLNKLPRRKFGIWEARIRNATFYKERNIFRV